MSSAYLLAVLTLALAAPAAAAAGPPKPLGRIVIPSIGVDDVFFNGQAAVDTASGPSHYPWSGMPGEGRTIAIAGHRVTHTHPFYELGSLRKHALVMIRFGRRFGERACYRVTGARVISPDDVGVTADVGFERLVLTTCTPPHFATYRLVVFARPGRCA
jgi:sortase A